MEEFVWFSRPSEASLKAGLYRRQKLPTDCPASNQIEAARRVLKKTFLLGPFVHVHWKEGPPEPLTVWMLGQKRGRPK